MKCRFDSWELMAYVGNFDWTKKFITGAEGNTVQVFNPQKDTTKRQNKYIGAETKDWRRLRFRWITYPSPSHTGAHGGASCRN